MLIQLFLISKIPLLNDNKILCLFSCFLLSEIPLLNVKRLTGCLMIFSVHPSKNVCVGMLYYEDASLDTSGRWGCMTMTCTSTVQSNHTHVFTTIYKKHCFSFRFGNSLRFRPIRQSSSDGDT